MPYRIQPIAATASFILEGLLMAAGSFLTGFRYVADSLVDKETMDQLRGADGALVGAVIIVVALWVAKLSDNKRLDRRHRETLDLQKDNSSQLKALTVEAIKAQGMTGSAIDRVNSTMQALTHELKERPCQAEKFKPATKLPELPTDSRL